MKRLEARQEGENVYRIVDPQVSEWRKRKIKTAKKFLRCLIAGLCIVYICIAVIGAFIALGWGFNLNAVPPAPTIDGVIAGFLIAGALVGSAIFVVVGIMEKLEI